MNRHEARVRGESRKAADRFLISIDVDGTLINTEYDDGLRPREIAAVRAVRAAGHEVALCTGRNELSAARIVASAEGALDGGPLVLLNGAVVLCGDPQRRLRHATMPRDVVRRLVDVFRRFRLAPMLFDSDDKGGVVTHEDMAINAVLGRYLSRRRQTVGGIVTVDDLAAVLPAASLELGTIDRDEPILAASEAIRAEMGDLVRVINTRSLLADESYLWMEVYHRDCDKGSGVKVLAAELGFRRERIVAIGDNYNELDMFAAAGWPVAMGNAPAEVRRAAARVAPHVADHGAAVILEEIADGIFPSDLA